MRDEADCCQSPRSTSSTKYIELKNGEGPEYPINSKKEKIKYIDLHVRRYRRISKRTLKVQENVKCLQNQRKF